jgi:hypothetical protein
MHATIRRHEPIDTTRTTEFVKQAQDSLLPRLSEMPGFSGYALIEDGNGVLSSVGFFDTEAHAEESTRVTSNWVRKQNLEKALPNPPRITSGRVLVHETRETRHGVTATPSRPLSAPGAK